MFQDSCTVASLMVFFNKPPHSSLSFRLKHLSHMYGIIVIPSVT